MKIFLSIFVFIATAVSVRALSAAKPKKILLAFDGTGNNARDFVPDPKTGASFSNVLKLLLLAGGSIDNSRNDIDGQICLYKRGLGGTSEKFLESKVNLVKGDLSQQTDPMMEMLEQVYVKGDELYIVGFSRGSSSARKFVTILDADGVKDSKTGEVVTDPTVECLGCFDTVSDQIKNLGKILKNMRRETFTKPSVLGEVDGKLSPIVKTAVHNVALDDNRCFEPFPPFPPVRMDFEDDRVHEVWFPGEHGDSGGTYYYKGIPDGSLQAMKEWFEECGLKFLEKGEDIHPDCVKINIEGYEDIVIDRSAMDIKPDASDTLHLMNKQQNEDPSHRPVIAITNEKVIPDATLRIHKSVLEHLESRLGSETPYAINPEILECADLVVVGSLDKELPDETKKFKELLSEIKTTIAAE